MEVIPDSTFYDYLDRIDSSNRIDYCMDCGEVIGETESDEPCCERCLEIKND